MRSAATALAGLLLSATLAGPTLATTEPSQAAGPENTATSSAASPAATPVADATKPADVSADQPAQSPDPAAAETAAPAQPEPAPAETASEAEPAAPADAAASSAPEVPATEQPAATAQPAPEEPAQAEVAEDSILTKELLQKITDAKSISKEDREALTAFYQERGENLLWLEGSSFTARAQAAMAEIRQADDWGLDASAFSLPDAPTSGEPADVADAELAFSLAVIKYANHARGGRMDPKRLSNYIDRDLNLVPTADLLTEVAARDDADTYLRRLHPQHPQFEKLRQAYLALKAGTAPVEPEPEPQAPAKGSKAKRAAAPEKVTERKLLVNMEQWRWMPEDWGQFHVWANIPEYTLRVSKHGHHIFTERMIVGKPDTQTPVFSDEMAFLVFHPFWGVPDSIKMKEILPSLARGSSAALDKNNLRIRYRGRDIDPGSVDWSRTDIRNFHVYQPPGGGNVLGQVKFMFPNKHQVYMHDTPTKNLFNASQRTFSHGCMRVRNPMRFAEVLLAQGKGWDKSRVAAQVSNSKPDNNVPLDTKIPVHMTYFTAWVQDDGKLSTYRDIYGHESRIQMGIEGKAHLIVKRKDELGPVRAEAIGRLVETRTGGGGGGSFSSKNTPDWARKVFGN